MSLSTLLTFPLRKAKMWRTGLGFGIHSPFAFGFVKNVLRNPHPYYAFRSEIKTDADRRLFRVVNYFNPRTIALVGDDVDRARHIISLCCPKAKIVDTPSGADFVYLARGGNLPADFRVLYAERPAMLPTGAMTFTNGRVCIAVRRPDLPAQSFLLNF